MKSLDKTICWEEMKHSVENGEKVFSISTKEAVTRQHADRVVEKEANSWKVFLYVSRVTENFELNKCWAMGAVMKMILTKIKSSS